MAFNAPPPDRFLDASIIHKTYKFYLLLYSLTKTFPKKDKFGIGLKCENIATDFLLLLLRANQSKEYKKIELLQAASSSLDLLKIFLRLTKDINILTDEQYLSAQSDLQEIGRMLGGWIKSLHAINPA